MTDMEGTHRRRSVEGYLRANASSGSASASSTITPSSTTTTLNPLEDFKQRISQWGKSRSAYTAVPEDEFELESRKDDNEEEGEASDLEDGSVQSDADEDSPYPEVRAAVRNYDEDVPCNTVRAWTIGLSLVVLGAATNTLFSLRQPSISIGALVAQILAWPLGHGWARVMPRREFVVPVLGLRWSLNPGPFNIKEHSIIVVMAGVAFSVAYATDIIIAQRVFYKQQFGLLFELCLTISTQSLGYGIAGLLRRFLVYPASMIWPGNLVAVALMNAMYESPPPPDPSIIGGSMPRYRWFAYVTLAAFLYYFIPGFFVQCLSVLAIPTFLAPQNPVVNQLFGGTTGMSLLPLTLDWTQVAGFVGSPLIPPWHAIANTLLGVVVFFTVGCTALHYSNVWYGRFLPISDASTYDNTGKAYDVSRVLTPELTLDAEAYRNYSPLFLSSTFALSYGLSFAAISSLVVHTLLHHGHTIWQQYRGASKEKPDIHMRLMRRYPEAPGWWYGGLFAVVLVLGFATVLGYPTHLTWWAFLLAVAMAFGFALPVGIVQAVTNNQIGLNVLTEFVYGYVQPGRPLALMLFKTYGYITMSQALSFVGDLKFGHYMKLPPRTLFWAQVVATTLGCVVQVVVLRLALGHIDGVCDRAQPNHFSCPGGRVFFSASVIWGLLGPERIFSPGQLYSSLLWFFVVGAVAPVAIWLAARRFPHSPIKHIMAPVVFGGAGNIPPATPLNYLSWGIVGFVFQYWIQRRHFAWWSRLNFLTSSALDLGLALSTLVIFFAFTLHEIDAPQWWGNRIVTSTMDFQGTAVQSVLPAGQTFGPASW